MPGGLPDGHICQKPDTVIIKDPGIANIFTINKSTQTLYQLAQQQHQTTNELIFLNISMISTLKNPAKCRKITISVHRLRVPLH